MFTKKGPQILKNKAIKKLKQTLSTT
jgi:hypothetical protein